MRALVLVLALLIRPDRDDAEYLELATRYPSAVAIAAGVEGVLIAPRWVLTSAQSATLFLGTKARAPLKLGTKPNAIQATFIHPDWRQGSDADIALILLRDPVEGILATPIRPDRDEIEETVFLVGHGETGKLGAGARATDGRRRAAINTVDRVTETTLRLKLKPHDEASDLQGALTPSERGAPIFLERLGHLSIVGIYSGTDGEWQVFTRVSSYTQWVDDAMFRAGAEEAARSR